MPQIRSLFWIGLPLMSLIFMSCGPDLDQLEDQRKISNKRRAEAAKSQSAEKSANPEARTRVKSIEGRWRLDQIISSRTDANMRAFQDAFRSPGAEFYFTFTDSEESPHLATIIEYKQGSCQVRVARPATYCCPGMHRVYFDSTQAPVFASSPARCASLDYLWNTTRGPAALELDYHFAHDSIDDTDEIWPLLTLDGPYPGNPYIPASTTFMRLIKVTEERR